MAKLSRPTRIRWHEITCPICSRRVRLTGQEYNYKRLQTCGQPTCTKAIHLSRDTPAAKIARLNAVAGKRLAAHAATPLSGGFETNASAKEWHLLSPDGTAYHFRNLALWLREHAELFDPADIAEVPQSKSGLTTRAQSRLGRLRPDRASRRETWKGWSWFERYS